MGSRVCLDKMENIKKSLAGLEAFTAMFQVEVY
jgi:hypothetical protein